MKVVSIPLASAYIEIWQEGDIDFGGKFGKDFGNGFKAEAYVDGWIQGPQKRFNVYGKGEVKLGDLVRVRRRDQRLPHRRRRLRRRSTAGASRSSSAPPTSGRRGAFNPMWSSCSISAVKAKKAMARVAGAKQTVTVPAGEEAYVMGFKGRAGAPEVTLTGPKGERVSTLGQSGVVNKDFLVVHIPEQNLTQVVLHEPAGGAWTVEVDDRSTPVDQVLTAESIPTPKVTAKVTGKGYNRKLEYDTSAVQDGQRVTFVEVGPKGADHVLGEVGSGKGPLRFTPMAGPGGVRPIKAVVTQGGVMRFNLEKVASFRATKPGIPAAPRNVMAKRKKGKRADTVTTTWTKVAGASEYRVTVVLNGRRQVYDTRKTRLKVPGLFDRSSATDLRGGRQRPRPGREGEQGEGRGAEGEAPAEEEEAVEPYARSWSIVHSRGSLSSRQRMNFAPCRIRLPVMWSKPISHTSSGRRPSHWRSSSDFQRLGPPDPRSPVRYGSSRAKQLLLLLRGEARRVADDVQVALLRRRARGSASRRCPSALPNRKAATTASSVRTRLIFTIPLRSPGRYGASASLATTPSD